MKKRTKKKIILVFASLLLFIVLSTSLFIYTVLGPFRTLFWDIPYLMGFFGSQHYLVLLQNNNELRPTGGFITAVAKIDTLFGYPRIEVFDSYQIPDPSPKVPAPEPFDYLIGSRDPFFAGWTVRDGNFSPDFSKSSADIIALYQKSYPNESIDGVFSLDFQVIEELLKNYGPVTVEDVTFDDANFFSNTQRISKNVDTHNVEELKSRKNILKPFVSSLTKVIVRSPLDYHRLSLSLAELALEKHILSYHTSPSIQKKFDALTMTGVLPPNEPSNDFLHVNIANIGGRKADRYMTKDIRYLADFSNPADYTSTLEVRLQHLGSYNIQSDIYQAYIRVYVPLDSTLESSSGDRLRATEVFEDLGFSVFADTIRMKPGDAVSLTYRYRLPTTIDPLDYRLHIASQPGDHNSNWRVAVKEMNDSSLENFSPELLEITSMQIFENLALWTGDLSTNKFFNIRPSADTHGPIILWQEFTALDEINVRVNEVLDTATVLNPQNYTLVDLDEKNPQHDTVVVSSIRFEGRDLWLTLQGVTSQYEEHYQLIIKDLKDVSGNASDPNPVERTLVQRLKVNLK
jgi:hypothetical protein